jgi:hypothetical protein
LETSVPMFIPTNAPTGSQLCFSDKRQSVRKIIT